MTRALTLDDIYRVPIVSSPQLSPDGSQVAYVVSVADRESDSMVSRIWLVTSDGAGRARPDRRTSAGRARPLTAGPYDRSPRWSPDGRGLAFTSKRQTDSQAQVFLISATGGEARKITEVELGAGTPVWSPDGARLAFVGTVDLDQRSAAEREHAPLVVRTADYKADGKGLVGSLRDHLFVADVASGETEPITSGDYWASNPVWSPDSARLAFDAAMHPDRDLEPGTHAFVVDASGGEPEPVTTGTGSVKTAAFTPDGERLLLCGTDREGVGHNRLLLQELGGGDPRDVAPGFDRNLMFGSTAYPGAPPQIVDDTIFFCARDRGCTHAFSVPLDGGSPRRIMGSADTVVSGLYAVSQRIAFVGASPQGPGEVFVATTDGGTPRMLTQHVGEALGSVELRSPEERTFTASDGTEIHGWLLASDQSGPGPLLLDVHGGPHNAWSPVFDGVHLYHQLLAARGWNILLVNPRGSDGYGEKFFAGVTGAWGVADMGDFTCALDALIDEGITERGRIAVTGYSYGGYMTNWLTAHTDYFAAAVSGGCLSNMASDFGTADSAIWHTMVELGGTPFEQPERFRELSPITAVTQVDTPTLLLHGEADMRCPIEQAEQWFTSLRARRVPVELVRYPGASHLFIMDGRPSHRRDYNERLVDWVVRHTQST